MFWVHYIYIYIWESFNQKWKTQKKKIIIKLLPWQWLDFFDSTHCPIQHNFQHFIIFYYSIIFPHQTLLLLIFNYFFLFILNHTRLLSSRFLHFILLNFITSSSTLLHLRFAFFLVHLCLLPILVQPCLFSSFEFQISQYDFFFSCTVHLFISFFFFLFRFFGLQNANLFWF